MALTFAKNSHFTSSIDYYRRVTKNIVLLITIDNTSKFAKQ